MLTNLFSAVVNMTVTASLVIALILPVRLLLKKAPKVFSYALWAVVLFRLLCPVSVAAPVSLLGAVDAPAEPAAEYMTVIAYVRPGTEVPAAPSHEVPETEQPLPEQGVTAPPAAEQPAAEKRLTDDLPGLWLAGVAAMWLWSGGAYLTLRRRLVGALRLEGNVYLADGIDSPFVMGALRPRIYLPSSLEERERGYILLHERCHIRRGDHVVKLLAFLALSLHWFNPLVWVAFILSSRDMEMSCDEAVVRQLGEGICRDYSASLLHLATGRRIISGTPLAFGEGDTGSRIRNMMGWKKPQRWMVLAGSLVCLAAVCACAVNPAGNGPQRGDAPLSDPADDSDLAGEYASVESYIASKMEKWDTVTYYTANGGEATAAVLDARIEYLARRGEVKGLAPEGTLEAWSYNCVMKIDADAEDVMLVGGMYEQDGWFDLEGQGGRNVVALRYPDGSLDILYDRVVNDNMDFYGYHTSCEEAIYDWYVAKYEVDLPLYVTDLGGANIPAHRFDGDGWYLYIPVSAWEKSDGYGDTWYSAYLTGSELTVYAPDSRSAADCCKHLVNTGMWEYGEDSDRYVHVRHKENGTEDFYYDLPGGESVQVRISWQPDMLGGMAGEVEVLRHMARSFTVDERIRRYDPQQQPIFTAGLQAVLYSLQQGEGDPVISLSKLGGDAVWGAYPAWGTANDGGYAWSLANFTWQRLDSVTQRMGQWVVRLYDPEQDWSLTFYEDANILSFQKGDERSVWQAEGDLFDAWSCARGWYDEAEYRSIDREDVLVPDRGQDWLEAAREGALQLQSLHLQATEGSKFCWTYVNCFVEAADDATENLRQWGEIGENTRCFSLTTVFLPENGAAYHDSMAGNTGDHTGIDPDAPEGAQEHYRCGYITKEDGGWRVSIGGTGW